MKKILFILIASLVPILAFSQKLNANAKNEKNTGIQKFSKLYIDDRNVKGVTIDTLRTVANKVLIDNIDLKTVLVQKADSNYRKSGSYTSRYDFKTEPTDDNIVKIWKKQGSILKLFPMCPPVFGVTAALSDGNLYTMRCYNPDTTTITGFTYTLTAQGNFVADAVNGIALYSLSGTTATYLGATANDGNIWKTAANAVSTANLTAPVTIYPGTYIIALMYNHSSQTTAPVLEAAGLGKTIGTSAGLGFGIVNYTSASTIFPTPTFTLSSSGFSFAFGIVGF